MDESQQLAINIVVGMRLPSAQVVRLCGSKPLQLMAPLKSDGHWRVTAFVGDLSLAVNKACLSVVGVEEHSSCIRELRARLLMYLPARELSRAKRESHTPFHPKCLIELILVACGKRHEIELEQIHECFYPLSGKNRICNLHNIYIDESYSHLYDYLGKIFESFLIPQDQQQALPESKLS